MAKHTKDYNDGYQAAIEAIKRQLDQQNGSSGNSNQSRNMPDDMTSPQDAVGNKNGDKSQNNNQSGNKSGKGQSDNHGVVTPQDCVGPSSINDVPGTAGGMISKSAGDDICDKEGYKKEGGSDSTVEREWKDVAIKEAGKLKGEGGAKLRSKINALYKTSSDWKKELRKITGMAISPDDKRQAFANKNVLVSQDRIARTDKDKYDNLDYMMAWIDSSGSMSDDQLRLCLSEVYSVALAKKPIKLIVVQCDTKIQDIKEYTNLAQLKKDISVATVKGRGGTELKPCWDLLSQDQKYKRRPAELVMIFTDGYLTQYKRNPRTMKNLCWVILDNPSWNIQYKDINTKAIHIKTSDIK